MNWRYRFGTRTQPEFNIFQVRVSHDDFEVINGGDTNESLAAIFSNTSGDYKISKQDPLDGQIICLTYPPVREASRWVANLTERKKSAFGVKEYIR